MAQITIGALDVRVAPGVTIDVQQWGNYGRSLDGDMRSDIRKNMRVFSVTTPPLTAAAMGTLRDALTGAQPLSVSGDMIGETASFHASGVRVQAITSDDWVVSFQIYETDESPLFAYTAWFFREVDGVLVLTDDPAVATHYLDTDAGGFFVTDTLADAGASLRYRSGDALMYTP